MLHGCIGWRTLTHRVPLQLYCNVEGLRLLNTTHVVAVSDKAKKKQPKVCREHDQAIQIFRLPFDISEEARLIPPAQSHHRVRLVLLVFGGIVAVIAVAGFLLVTPWRRGEEGKRGRGRGGAAGEQQPMLR